MKQVAPLHDIGKTYIDETLFNKPTRLTKEEFEEIKLHTIKGAEFIEQTLKDCTGTLYFQMAYNVAKYHHEWWNGTGYPLGLKGEEIPLCARIMAVADVYDALISKRPYKDVISFKDATEMIKSQSGSHFDPEIVKAFENIQDKIFSYLSQEK